MWRRAATLVLLLAATATACGIPADDSPRVVTDRAMPEELDDATDSADGQRTRTVIFFSRFDDDRGDILVPTEREVPTGGPSGEPTPGTVLEALFAGVEGDTEAGERLVTKVPADTDLASQPQLAPDGTLTIDLNSAISGVQSDGAQLAYGQMVCTVTSLERVDQVLFTVDGQPTWPPTGEGISSDGPLTCTSYASLLADDADDADDDAGSGEDAATSAAPGLG